jgi:hypothetical protein
MQYLGFQDAPRKFRPPSQLKAGAWTGTIFAVSPDNITKTVSMDKWHKGQTVLSNLKNQCDMASDTSVGRPTLCRKELERSTGFLNHLATTYDEMTPYLKGFYLTLNSWRPKRNDEDWKVSDKVWVQMLMFQLEKKLISMEEFDAAMDENIGNAPGEVIASPRFKDDVNALSKLLASLTPPVVRLRSKQVITVIYGFGDASGTGLGATFTCGSGFTFRIGVWGPDDADQSSNWREFTNIVDALEDEAQTGNLDYSEVFMFTDNSTVESCAVKGSSSSSRLLDLIIRLRCLGTDYGIKVSIFHIAGTRMIAQGTDGVLRGFLGAGVMSGESMISYIPIHLSACDRSSQLLPWVTSWTKTGVSSDLIPLSVKDWFDVGHDISGWHPSWDGFDRPVLTHGRVYLWTPSPYVADVALAELRKARIKRQKSSHVFICPRLCTTLWIRQLFKAADIVFEIPAGTSFWSKEMHEPLLIGILFPFIRCKPWQLRSTPKLFAVARELRGLCKGPEVDLRNFLREFWGKCHRLADMPPDVVRRLLFLGR